MEGFTFLESQALAILLNMNMSMIDSAECFQLNPDDTANFAYAIEKMTNPKRRESARAEQQYPYAVAYRIAKGQVIDSVIKLGEFVNTLSAGGANDTFMKERAFEMIAAAAGSNDLVALYQSNLVALNGVMARLSENASRNIGTGMHGFLGRNSREGGSNSGLGSN
jgi:hypothetical protein